METSLTHKKTTKFIKILLAVAGVAVSLYLTYIKLSADPFICGLGDCGKVATSEYANIFGIPVALFGVGFYFILLFLIFNNLRKLEMYWLLWGILFSSYLTYLELFVIKAICGWCVISFVIIILIGVLHFIETKVLTKESNMINTDEKNI